MTNTPFSKRVEILGSYYAEVCENDNVMQSNLMQDYSDTFFLCLAHITGNIIIQEKYSPNVDIVWDAFCELWDMDNYGQYNSLADFIELAHA